MIDRAPERPLEETANGGTGLLRSEVRRLVSGVNLIVLILAILSGLWGALDSMTDADGERFLGNLAFAAPSVYAGWCMFEPAVRRSTDALSVVMRTMTACLIAPAFVGLPVGVVLGITVLFPGIRDLIAAAEAENNGFHYYWSEGVVSQVFLVSFAGIVIGMCVALGVCLILTMPILSLRAPGAVSAGSRIETVDGAKRDSTAAFVFCGLGVTIVGIILWVSGDGGSILDVPAALGDLFTDLSSYGYFHWDEAAWVCGALLVGVGVTMMGWGCARVIRAPRAADDR